jgi:hypothetical protein
MVLRWFTDGRWRRAPENKAILFGLRYLDIEVFRFWYITLRYLCLFKQLKIKIL